MANNITPITASFPLTKKPDTFKDSNESSFKDVLMNALQEVNQIDQTAAKESSELATGSADNLHTIMIDTEKADIALQLTLQVRSKILDAYNEVMRMQI